MHTETTRYVLFSLSRLSICGARSLLATVQGDLTMTWAARDVLTMNSFKTRHLGSRVRPFTFYSVPYS